MYVCILVEGNIKGTDLCTFPMYYSRFQYGCPNGKCKWRDVYISNKMVAYVTYHRCYMIYVAL